nr:hypothetical protein [uncultured Prevotella sp.]
MFKPLPPNFHAHMFGLDVRLATAEDAEFILSLRTDENLSKNIHGTENDLHKHLLWFAKYKEREAEGRDYYFIYFKGGKPVGVNRTYNIYEYYGTPGSWICKRDNDPNVSLATYFFAREIQFQILQLDLLVYDVRKANKKVWKMHKLLGAKNVGESEIDYYFTMNKTDYYQNRDKVLRTLGIEI